MSNGRMSNGTTGSPPRSGIPSQSHYIWTDDLPVCYLSGIGYSTNQMYRRDGSPSQEHDFEDRSFHFRFDDDCFLYGVFDGHSGCGASNFAAQKMPAELLFDRQLMDTTNDEDVKDVLNQSFVAVEKAFFESIDNLLAEKTTLHLQLPEGISEHEAYRQSPEIVTRLQNLDSEISGGTTATLVLIYKNKLYVANVGDTRALLCKTDENGVLHVMTLSVDHTIANEEEQHRLAQLGLDVELLKQMRRLGSSDNTRCIGDYHVKGGYKDIDILSQARSEPVTADPFVVGGIPLDETCSFLIIMSDGLYGALQDATMTEHVNADIASMVAQEFSLQSTLNGVAQAVVDKVVRIHHDTYMMRCQDGGRQFYQKRGDITLLVRNFNCQLTSTLSSPIGVRYHPVSVPFYQGHTSIPPSISIPSPPLAFVGSSIVNPEGNLLVPASGNLTPTTPTNNLMDEYQTVESTDSPAESRLGTGYTASDTYTSTNSTQSSGESRFPSRYFKQEKLQLDKDGKIEAYVDFSDFYKAIEEMSETQRETLNAETKPKSTWETINEESDSAQSAPEN